MRRTTLVVGIVLLCLGVCFRPSIRERLTGTPDPPRLPLPNHPGVVDLRLVNPHREIIIDYEGQVTEIASASITLLVYFANSELGNRTGTGLTYRFRLSKLLAAGRIPPRNQIPRGVCGYGQDDVRVGDVIELTTRLYPGDYEEAEFISIIRRPGGRVPREAYEIPFKEDAYAWHTMMNAYQDFEEHGTPLPDRFDRTGHGTAFLLQRMARIRAVLGQPEPVNGPWKAKPIVLPPEMRAKPES